ncbi:MAG: SRPBCC domain-containing protein [Ferruginibacter sp.]
MTSSNRLEIVKDLPNKKIIVTRDFEAPMEEVWRAWTERESLDKWWAPKPWKAATKFLDFSEGGYWLYAMVGPDDSKHWCRVDFKKIDTHKSFLATDLFCDEDGNPTMEFPGMNWKNEFLATDQGTKVTVEISFASISDLEKIVEMGFESGFTAGLSNLELLLKNNAITANS